MSTTAVKMTTEERRQWLIDTLYAKLDDPDLPGHAFAKISGSITALEKLIARDEDEDEEEVSLAGALASMPIEHAQELLVTEFERLTTARSSIRERLVELVGEEATAKVVD